MFYRLVLTAVLATALALAQGRGGGGGDMGEMGGASGGGRGGMNLPSTSSRPTRFDQMSQVLKLDKAQKKEIKNIMDAAQKDATPVREQVVKDRLAIGDAIQEGKSQDEINQLAGSEAVVETQMASIELNAFAKIFKLLNKDQQAQTRAVFQMMKGAFNGKNWNSEE